MGTGLPASRYFGASFGVLLTHHEGSPGWEACPAGHAGTITSTTDTCTRCQPGAELCTWQ